MAPLSDADRDGLAGNVVLPEPSAAAAQRARPLFEKLVEQLRAEPEATATMAAAMAADSAAAGSRSPASAAPPTFGRGRRYDLALSILPKVAAAAQATAAQAMAVQAATAQAQHAEQAAAAGSRKAARRQLPRPRQPLPVASSADASALLPDAGALAAEEETRIALPPQAPLPTPLSAEKTSLNLPTRPPAGAPSVRPPVQQRQPAAPQAEALLSLAAQTAMLRSEPGGAMSFDIAFNDDIFVDMACTISVHAGRATATFRVQDDNSRRLLEAEAPRLRDGLERRGLKVTAVQVLKE